ncbi:MAG: acyltransferase [Acidimicrobiales bacterium]
MVIDSDNTSALRVPLTAGGTQSVATVTDADGVLLPSGDDAGTEPGDRPFRPDVQGLRALAVALVVYYHAGFPGLHGGFVGVDVFFVISGFVITGLLLREREVRHKTSLLRFYARRARRILPASCLVIVATVFASWHWLGSVGAESVRTSGEWSAIFLANFHAISVGTNYFLQGTSGSPLLHYWSLAVEEQFYLVYPALFILVAALFKNRSFHARLALALAIVIAASLTFSVLSTHTTPINAYYSPLTRAWELALGGLVAVGTSVLRKVPVALATAMTWTGLAGIVTAGLVLSNSTSYPGYAVALPGFATGVVLAGGAVAPPFGAELVLGRWLLLRGGDISYSLYLWHYPILIIATEQAFTPLPTTTRLWLVGLAVALSVASYYLVENPVRHMRALRTRPWRSLALGAGLILSTVLICAYAVP